jgi:Glycosyltransferase family 87
MNQLEPRFSIASLKRRWSAPFFWLLIALLPAIVIVAAYQIPYLYSITMERCNDSPWVSKFEYGGTVSGTGFCWSSKNSVLSFPAVAQNQGYQLSLRLAGARPKNMPAPELTVVVNGRPVEKLEVASTWQTYKIPLTPERVAQAEDLRVELRVPTFRPSQAIPGSEDNRALGVSVNWARLKPQSQAAAIGVLPPLSYAFGWLTISWLGAAILLRILFAGARRLSIAAVLGEQVVLLLVLTHARTLAASFLVYALVAFAVVWFLANQVPLWLSQHRQSPIEFIHTLGIANSRWRMVIEFTAIMTLGVDFFLNRVWPLRTHSLFDFVAYYAGAAVAMNGGDYYNQQILQQYITSHGLLQGEVAFLYPPVAILFFAPFLRLSLIDAKTVWLLLDFAWLIGAGVFLTLALRRSARAPASPLWFALLALARPVGATIGSGQVGTLLLFLSAIGLWAWSAQRARLAGAITAMAAAIKVFPALLLAYFLYRRNWRAVASGIVVGAALFVASLWPGGIKAWGSFLTQGLTGIPVDFNDPFDQSVNGFLQRFGATLSAAFGWRDINGSSYLALRILALLIALAFVGLTVWRFSHQHACTARQAQLEYAIVVALMLLVLPIVREDYLVLLILPMFILINVLSDYSFSTRTQWMLILSLGLTWLFMEYGPLIYNYPGFPTGLKSLGLLAVLFVYFSSLYVLALISNPARIHEPELLLASAQANR